MIPMFISLLLFFSTPICPADVEPCVSPDPPYIRSNAVYLPMVFGS